MKPLRVAFDLDGVLADFGAAYRALERQLFGSVARDDTMPEPDTEGSEAAAQEGLESSGEAPAAPQELRRRREIVWEAIRSTEDFWAGLAPLEPGAVRLIHEAAIRHRWEVVFITQRPGTAGPTVQRQTQRWLVEQGFDLPVVLTIDGARGKLAGVLRWDYLVDDHPANCVDALAESAARPILILRKDDPNRSSTEASARRLGIVVAGSVTEAVSQIERAQVPSAAARLGQAVSRFWRS